MEIKTEKPGGDDVFVTTTFSLTGSASLPLGATTSLPLGRSADALLELFEESGAPELPDSFKDDEDDITDDTIIKVVTVKKSEGGGAFVDTSLQTLTANLTTPQVPAGTSRKLLQLQDDAFETETEFRSQIDDADNTEERLTMVKKPTTATLSASTSPRPRSRRTPTLAS